MVKLHKKPSKKNGIFYEVIDPEITCWFLGENGPNPKGNKPNETLPWKMWIIEQYLELNPNMTKVVIWEDREEHVREFEALNDLLEPEIVVQFVKN